MGHDGDAEIDQDRRAVLAEHDVFRPQIVVGQAGGVGHAQTLGDLLGQFQRLDDRQGLPVVAQIGQLFGQRFAWEVVDDGIGEAVVGHVEVTDNGDAGVFQLRDGFHAAAEALDQILVFFFRHAQDFQKNEPLQLDVTREEQIAGRSGRDVRFDLVVAYLLTRQVFFIPCHHNCCCSRLCRGCGRFRRTLLLPTRQP